MTDAYRPRGRVGPRRPSPRDPLAGTCPTCGRRFLFDETPTPPFCSERCQLVDLGRWLDEEIGLPLESESEAGDSDHDDE